MKKYFLITLLLFVVLAVTSCNKQKKDPESISTETIEKEKIPAETTTKIKEDNQDSQFLYNYEHQDTLSGIIPGKDGRPDELDIASGHKIKIENWYSQLLSSDGRYTAYENQEYYYIYERYCIPNEGERKDLNLIMFKKDAPIYNPNDLGAKNKDIGGPGCEFVAIARTSFPMVFDSKVWYWFKISEDKWVPGSSVYIQKGGFERLPVEDLELGMAYEEITDGAWFVVKTDAGSPLKIFDSSNKRSAKEISTIPQGTWIYAEAQTTDTEVIDEIEGHWYKIAYPEKGYVFGGYLEKQEGVCGLKFPSIDISSYIHDDSKNYKFKVYSAPTTKSQFLGEYEIIPDEYGYLALIETKDYETIDGVNGLWIYIEEPVKGFIFGYNFVYK